MKETGSQVTIAMDGPAGSGKSTVARRIAEELGLLYLDHVGFRDCSYALSESIIFLMYIQYLGGFRNVFHLC